MTRCTCGTPMGPAGCPYCDRASGNVRLIPEGEPQLVHLDLRPEKQRLRAAKSRFDKKPGHRACVACGRRVTWARWEQAEFTWRAMENADGRVSAAEFRCSSTRPCAGEG
jgi:hypothetical protein